MSDIVERLSDILDAIEHGVVTITAHDVATIATARAEIIELRERMQLHEAYREVAKAAVMRRDSMLKRDSSFVANRLLYNALQKHSAAIRAAMEDGDG